MTPTQTLSAGTPPLPAAPAPSTPSPARATLNLSSDFETFLKMLTAQARYQDPLEPIDSTEYASQLAQFSMVEQQVKSNEVLQSLFDHFGLQSAAALASWVGKEVRAVSPASFTGQPITVVPPVVAGADQATLVVYDDQGGEQERLAIATTGDPVSWTGLDDTGAPYPAGNYTFEVESHSNGELIGKDPAAVYSRVSETQIDSGTVVLLLEGGHTVPATEVSAIRDPAVTH